MIAKYKGHTITVTREEGWLCFVVVRESDGYFCVEGSYCDCADTVREMVGYMKERVDGELAGDDPWGQKEECGCHGGCDLCSVWRTWS